MAERYFGAQATDPLREIQLERAPLLRLRLLQW